MDKNCNPYCKIFIDTDKSRDEILGFLLDFMRGEEEKGVISNSICNLNVVKNDDYNEHQKQIYPDGFLYFRYYLEMEPEHDTRFSIYTSFVAELLEELWRRNLKAVAACDFEELLPEKGGYNRRVEEN